MKNIFQFRWRHLLSITTRSECLHGFKIRHLDRYIYVHRTWEWTRSTLETLSILGVDGIAVFYSFRRCHRNYRKIISVNDPLLLLAPITFLMVLNALAVFHAKAHFVSTCTTYAMEHVSLLLLEEYQTLLSNSQAKRRKKTM